MKLDDAINATFAHEVKACRGRSPDAAEVSDACNQILVKRVEGRGFRIGDLAPLLAMAAVALFALVLDPVHLMSVRPLARELVVTVPDDAGSRFLDFVLEAGESYRSDN